MVHRVEDLDDVALALDGVRNEDRRGIEVQSFDQEGFSVARLAVEQKRIGRTDGGADLRQQLFGDHHPAERSGEGLPGQPSMLGPLQADHFQVLVERNGGRARVLIGLQRLTGAGAARIGEGEDGADAADRQRALYLHVVAQFEVLDQLLNQAEFQPDGRGEVLAIEIAAEIQDLENYRLQCGLGDSRLRYGRGLLGDSRN